MEARQPSDLRKHRVWNARCVSLANVIENAAKTSGLSYWHFLNDINMRDRQQILKIITQRKIWKSRL